MQQLGGYATIAGAPTGIASALTGAVLGLEAHAVRVEVACTRGPAFFQMVGLAEATVREARVRVASALARLGILLDEYAITVNLAPAELRKSGASLDLALAAGVLAAIGHLPSGALDGVVLLGELSLGGELRPVRGILPQLEGARLRGASSAILPSANAREAGLVRGLPVYQAEDLAAVRAHLLGERRLSRVQFTAFEPRAIPRGEADLADVRGQHAARRSLEIVAAGHHNLIFIGPPGAGKTLLARLLPTILPPLSFEEAFESTAIHSVAGLLDPAQGIVAVRPFRAPHHSVSEAGLVGGGDVPRPGEVSLAHHGVLFLDELAEFPRSVLEALRQPLEDGRVCIARARARAWFPARPLVVAAVNPCPCGHYGHPTRRCRCSVAERRRYLARLSGPLVDRLDVHVAVPPVEMPALAARGRAESSAVVRERVTRARAIQAERCERGRVSAPYNAALSLPELEQVANLGPAAAKLLAAAVRQLGLSARAFLRVLRVARSIADLEAASDVREEHVAEAVQGRLLDRDDWD